MSALRWDAASGAAVVAALGLVVAVALLQARRLLRRPGARPLPAVLCAVARAGAVAAGLVAAAGPHLVHAVPRSGAVLVAAPDAARPSRHPSAVLTWPTDAPDAAAALSALRAAAPPDLPADVVLVAPRGLRASPALVAALQPSAALRTAVLGVDDGDAPTSAAPPLPAPRLLAPAGACEGVDVVLVAEAVGSPFTRGSGRVAAAGRELPADLEEGATRAALPALRLDAGEHRVVFRAPGRLPAVAFVHVRRAPRVVVVGDESVRAGPLAAHLAVQGLPTRVLTPQEVAAAGFGVADVFVVAAGAAGGTLETRLGARLDEGAGLLVLGGPGAGGLRRFADGPLAARLPVSLPPPPPPPPPAPPAPPPPAPPPPDPERPHTELEDGPKQALRVALLLVVDRSGSMAGAKLQLAQNAARAAARSLAPGDRVGVIAFDDAAEWIAPFQDAGDTATLARRVAGLRADGGTHFFPALRDGFEAITREDAGIRHVILLTDGVTRDAVFRPLVEQAAQRAVTLSTVAVGDDADTNLLALLAGWGHGRMYLANDPRRLPEIVTVDTRRFTVEERERRAVEDASRRAPEGLPPTPPDAPDAPPAEARPPQPPTAETTPPEPPRAPPTRRPHVVGRAPALAGLGGAVWPELAHAEAPGVRTPAQVVLAWDDDAPALVLGRSGAARVAVLAADAATLDARALFAWEEGGRFLAQLVRSLAPPEDTPAAGLVAEVVPVADGGARIVLPGGVGGELHAVPIEAGAPADAVDGTCGGAGGSTAELRLARMPAQGLWAGSLTPADGGPRPVAFVSPGAARAPEGGAEALARAADVPLVASLPAPRAAVPGERREEHDAPWLAACGVLLVAEAALRRLA